MRKLDLLDLLFLIIVTAIFISLIIDRNYIKSFKNNQPPENQTDAVVSNVFFV